VGLSDSFHSCSEALDSLEDRARFMGVLTEMLGDPNRTGDYEMESRLVFDP
jgi:hypothetical protein